MTRENDKVSVYQRIDGKYDWHRKDEEGRVLDESNQGYENEAYAKQMAEDLNPGMTVEIETIK